MHVCGFSLVELTFMLSLVCSDYDGSYGNSGTPRLLHDYSHAKFIYIVGDRPTDRQTIARNQREGEREK